MYFVDRVIIDTMDTLMLEKDGFADIYPHNTMAIG